MDTLTLYKIKQALRVTHDKLDDDIQAEIDAARTDLAVAGIVHAAPDDPLIYNAVKLWCKASFTDDSAKAAEFLRRYEALKACLMMAEGYGHPKEETADE